MYGSTVRSDLVAKLGGLVAVGLPCVGLALADSVSLPVLIGGGVIALLVATPITLGSLGARADHVEELERALDRLEDRIDAAVLRQRGVRARAELAGRFREEFVAAVRHELKTPLNAILGFSDVLHQEVDGPLTDKQREDVEAVRSAGIYLRQLVDAVLAEWHPDHDAPLPLAPVDLKALLEQVVRILQGQVAGRPIELRADVPPDMSSPLADERRLRQVLINLGTNALRATETGIIVLSARDEGDEVRLSVRDSGTGIDPQRLPELFEEYSQLGPERSRQGGSGLGLSLVREMVEWHGGRVEVETQLGEGSSFQVVLPKDILPSKEGS